MCPEEGNRRFQLATIVAGGEYYINANSPHVDRLKRDFKYFNYRVVQGETLDEMAKTLFEPVDDRMFVNPTLPQHEEEEDNPEEEDVDDDY